MDIQDNLHVIQERIVKTDEVIRVLDVKKKEANKLDKNYKKLIEKFCAKHTEIVSLKKECQKLNSHLANSTEIYLSCQKEIKELKTQNEFLKHNHNEYVNTAQNKYQSACQEIATLNEKYDILNKKIEKDESKDSKRIHKSKLRQKINQLETKLESFEIEKDFLIQMHKTDVIHLKKQHEKERELFETELKEFRNKINEDTHIIKEKQYHQNNILEATKKHEIEKKLLKDHIAKLESKMNIEVKNYENDKKYLNAQLEEFKKKISDEANKIKETTGTQTCYEDIYNLEDILTEMHNLPSLLSPLISESSVTQDTDNDITKKCSIAIGTDDVIPTFIDASSQTCESKIKVRSFNLCTEIFNNVDIPVEKSNCSVGTETDDLTTLIDSSQQTNEVVFPVAVATNELCESLSGNPSKTDARPINLSREMFKKTNIPVEKFNCSVATCTADFITLIDSCIQTNEDVFPVAVSTTEICESVSVNSSKTDVRTIYLSRELFNKTNISVEKLSSMETNDEATEDNDEIYVHIIPVKSSTCSRAVGSDDIIPTFTDTSSQTCDSVNENKIKVRSFDLCTEVFNKTITPMEKITETTDSSTQTSNSNNNHQNIIEFKSFEPSIVTLPKKNILEEIPKIVKLKSRVTKKYKNNNNNRLLKTLRNSKLNLKCLLEKYINTSSKFVIVSSSILKTDNSKTKIPDNCEQKVEGCSNSYYSNCPHTVRNENCCSCSCQHNMFYNRYFGQCPVYQIPCDYNHDIYCRTNNCRNYYDMKQQFKSKHENIDDIFSSSDSDEEDNNLRKVLREYKNSVIKKYITNKYLAKIAKKNKNWPPDNLKNNFSNTNLFINREKNKEKLSHKKKIKNKFPKYKPIIFSSDSEEETAEFLSNYRNKTNTISSNTISNTSTLNVKDVFEKNRKCSFNKVVGKNTRSIPKEKEKNETVSNSTKINNSSNANFNITTNNESSDEEIQDFSEYINETPDEIIRTPKKNINIELEENMTIRTEENRRLAGTLNKISEENISTPVENNKRMEKSNTNIELKEIVRKRLQGNTKPAAENANRRIFEENIGNKTFKNNQKHATTSKLPFILSKKQQLLLRKGKALKKRSNVMKTTSNKELPSPIKTYAPRSEIIDNPLKRKCSVRNEVEVVYKKQKQDLFGSDSDISSVDECEISEKFLINSVDDCETSEKVPDSIHTVDISNCNRINKNETFEQNETKTDWKKSSERSLMSNDKSNKENVSDITIEYTSNLQTKTRIALKTPEACTTSMDVNVVTNMDTNISVLSTECTSLLNDETITATTNKVFKRPGICTITTPHIKKNKTQKVCEFIRTDTNTDSPDLANSSSAKINDFVSFNKLERSTASIVKKENESQGIERQIDIGVAKKLIQDVATMDWNKQLMATVVSYLADKNTAIVARLIVNQAAKDFSQEFDKSFTPPAPLLTITQQKIMVLLNHLEKKNLPNIHTIFLHTVETRLLSETRVEVVHPLTRLYVASCKIKYEIEKVRTLCCNAAYYMGDLLLPLMFIVLTMWGDILPMAADSEDIPLATAIVRVIHLKNCKRPGYNFGNLKRLLFDYYSYEIGNHEEIIKQLIRSYSANYSKTAYTAIVILHKNLPHKSTYNDIKNHLLPLLENCNNSDNKLMTISLIQRLVAQFQSMADRDYIVDIKNCLSKYVIHPGVVPSNLT